MSVLQTNAFPVGYSAVTGIFGNFLRFSNIGKCLLAARGRKVTVKNNECQCKNAIFFDDESFV